VAIVVVVVAVVVVPIVIKVVPGYGADVCRKTIRGLFGWGFGRWMTRKIVSACLF